MHKLKPELIKLSAKERLYGVEIPIIGLTGGIATGKSSVSKFLIENSYPLIDADSLVKDIYTQAKTIQFIKSLAPSVIVNSSIDFKALRVLFFENSIIKAEIEKFIYSKLPGIFADKLSKLDLKNHNFIIYDVPLLFEKKLTAFFDLNILVYCNQNCQIERLMARDKITIELAQQILASQIDIELKKSMSQFCLSNESTIESLHQNTKKLLLKLITQDNAQQ